MAFEAGERVIAEINRRGLGMGPSHHRGYRRGLIEEVMRGDPRPRYRIRWDDGKESIHSASGGTLRRETAADTEE